MAKKKTAKKPAKAPARKTAPKPKAKKKEAPKPRLVKKTTPETAKAPKPRKPRAQALPGMEQMALDPILDAACQTIADCRDAANEARSEEKDALQSALHRLQQLGRHQYKRHGIELMRVTGNDKLRVRRVGDDESDGGDAATGEGEGPRHQPDDDVLDEGNGGTTTEPVADDDDGGDAGDDWDE